MLFRSSIGGTSVNSFIVNSDTQITAVAATGSNGIISITTPNGTAVSSNTFSVVGLNYYVTVPKGTNECYISGTMNTWKFKTMTKVDETHYVLNIPTATTNDTYKYLSGPNWSYEDKQTAGSLNTGRIYQSNDTVSNWENIYDPAIGSTDITYTVTVPMGTNTCYITGDMNDWTFTAMTKLNETHYSIVFPSYTYYRYGYCSGSDWAYMEVDANNNFPDRSYSVSDVVTKWKSVYAPVTDPGTASLTHQWTFDDGTAKDNIGTADGILQGVAKISNNSLNTTNGGYLDLPGAVIGINTYSALTTEMWFTSVAGNNPGYTMLSYFGNSKGTYGTDYLFTTTARGDNKSRTAISCGNTTSPWANETGADGIKYDDGLLHHMVSVIDSTSISFYIDGARVSSAILSDVNKISAISTTFAYLCKSGYSIDPTWKGFIHKFSMYNKALTNSEVLYLYQHGDSVNVKDNGLKFSTDILLNRIQFTNLSTGNREDRKSTRLNSSH